MNRYDPLVTRTTHAVLETKGATPSELRWAAFHRRMEDLPPAFAPYVEKVARHAYKVSDEDIESLKRAGYSEDEIFEVTVSAALGAALQRLERGLIALHESKS